MSTADQGDLVFSRDRGTDISIGDREIRERRPDIEVSNHPSGSLDSANRCTHLTSKGAKQIGLPGGHSVLRAKHFGLILLEFRGYVAFRRGQGLPSLVIGRDPVRVSSGNLDVVTEDSIVADLERPDPSPFAFALLDGSDILLPAIAEAPRFIELGVITRANDTSFGQRYREPGFEGRFQRGRHVFQEIELGCKLFEGVACRRRGHQLLQGGQDQGQPEKRSPECAQLPGVSTPGGGPPGEPLQVANPVNCLPGDLPGCGMFDCGGHRVETTVDFAGVPEGRLDPLTKEASPHWGFGRVEGFEQGDTASPGPQRLDQLQVTPSHFVEPEVLGRSPDGGTKKVRHPARL